VGKHLTPAERAAIVARYIETANGHQVAREFGVSEYTVRQSVARANATRKNALHARAVAAAIRKARKLLAANVEMVSRYLAKHAGVDGVPDLEPKDVSALLNAQSNVSAKLMEVEERLEAKRMARLSRDLKRQEIEIATKRAKGEHVEQVSVDASDELVEKLKRALHGTGG
jgi:transposase